MIRPRRPCDWCRGPIDPTVRADARFCSKRCRQASHRFTRDTTRRAAHDVSTPMRLAYADPPYPGLSARYYAGHPDFAGEVDHRALLEQLSSPGGYDGWALSTSARALPDVLGLCVDLGLQVRVAAWVRGARPHTHPRGPLTSWEPVVYAGGRDGSTRLDSLVHHARPRLSDPSRVIGAKPAAFARWLFELLGAAPGDTLDDLFSRLGRHRPRVGDLHRCVALGHRRRVDRALRRHARRSFGAHHARRVPPTVSTALPTGVQAAHRRAVGAGALRDGAGRIAEWEPRPMPANWQPDRRPR